MLTRIRNAGMAKFSSVDVPGSKLKVEIARILKDEGFIKNYKILKDGKQGILRDLPEVRDGAGQRHLQPASGSAGPVGGRT